MEDDRTLWLLLFVEKAKLENHRIQKEMKEECVWRERERRGKKDWTAEKQKNVDKAEDKALPHSICIDFSVDTGVRVKGGSSLVCFGLRLMTAKASLETGLLLLLERLYLSLMHFNHGHEDHFFYLRERGEEARLPQRVLLEKARLDWKMNACGTPPRRPRQ